MRKLNLFTLLFFLISYCLTAQEQVGLRTSNYAGMNGSFLNPASSSSYALQWELNLFAAGVFFENNFAFITDTSTPDLIKNGSDLMAGYGDTGPNSALKYDFYSDSTATRGANLSFKLNGPSLLFKTETGQAFGLFANLRAEWGTANVSGIYNYYYFSNKFVLERIPLSPVKTSAMLWGEIGAHFSQQIETAAGHLSFGINAKVLQGYEATYLDLSSMTYSMSINSDTVSVEGAAINFGYTTSNIDMIGGGDELERDINGLGLGFDLGVNYIVDGYEGNYALKIGVSLLDVGAIKFNKNTEAHGFDTDDFFNIAESDYTSYSTLAEFQDQISLDALGDPETSLKANEFTVWLPSAISVQADVNIWEGLYASGIWMQRLAFSDIHLKRGNLINITPRYQHKWGEIHLPISLYNYNDLNMGLALRLGFLTIGTDNLGSFTKSKEYTGTDFYLGLKIFPFSPKLNFAGLSFGGKGGKKVKCYDF